jgi:hypothetical protein
VLAEFTKFQWWAVFRIEDYHLKALSESFTISKYSSIAERLYDSSKSALADHLKSVGYLYN